jgi:DnaK suppressor protein
LTSPHTRLIELHRAAAERVERLTQRFEDIVEAASDVATDDEHDPEGHTIAWERQQAYALIQEANAELHAIEAALRRVDSGTYDTCACCGRAIGAERLDALPGTDTCIRCAGQR